MKKSRTNPKQDPTARALAEAQELVNALWAQHPWHGATAGEQAPQMVNAFIEIVPTDTVKYELDKRSGHLRIDRPHRFSNVCPMLYGFIPQTYCGAKIGLFCAKKVGRKNIPGDGDPLDICVLTEKSVSHGNIFANARPIGGLRMIDKGQADDKIIAVLQDDLVFGDYQDISDCPADLIDRLKHYFLTYKQLPGREKRRVEIAAVYGQKEACQVIEASVADYHDSYGSPEKRLAALKLLLTAGVAAR